MKDNFEQLIEALEQHLQAMTELERENFFQPFNQEQSLGSLSLGTYLQHFASAYSDWTKDLEFDLIELKGAEIEFSAPSNNLILEDKEALSFKTSQLPTALNHAA